MSGVRVPTGEATFGEFANCGGHIQHSFTQCNHRVAVMQHEWIEPLGESRSDHPIFLDLATRLGLGAMYSEGMTELDWCRRLFEGTDLPWAVSWKDFVRKGYSVVPAPSVARRDPVSYRWFAEGRAKDTPALTPLPSGDAGRLRHGLRTQTGQIEFGSSSFKCFDPDDPARAPLLGHVAAWEGPQATELHGKHSTVNDTADHCALAVDSWLLEVRRLASGG